jgi:hypothetical protein
MKNKKYPYLYRKWRQKDGTKAELYILRGNAYGDCGVGLKTTFIDTTNCRIYVTHCPDCDYVGLGIITNKKKK